MEFSNIQMLKFILKLIHMGNLHQYSDLLWS
ncbi:hypothetical protein HBHAL_2668 [Halobacillus halophilus DSM 2266]|uniref:Uncharacterized protein n=1 Tax=Halobacillus halophilus (strain ATCC 35676 / DSM 2266 / JCM 20832 / KCTC 3685 / LMG 17431 / NBRC 102448 / NCIMB 2269) TaxID=866895 RepID=I0JLJ8_HALH3|nr:hypothetical protein HBHAL_2668 [Halobacillus halophilus DSM 2266]